MFLQRTRTIIDLKIPNKLHRSLEDDKCYGKKSTSGGGGGVPQWEKTAILNSYRIGLLQKASLEQRLPSGKWSAHRCLGTAWAWAGGGTSGGLWGWDEAAGAAGKEFRDGTELNSARCRWPQSFWPEGSEAWSCHELTRDKAPGKEGVFIEPVVENRAPGSGHVHLENLLGDQAVTLSKQSDTRVSALGWKLRWRNTFGSSGPVSSIRSQEARLKPQSGQRRGAWGHPWVLWHRKPADTGKPAEGPRSVKARASGGAEGEESPPGKRQGCLCRRWCQVSTTAAGSRAGEPAETFGGTVGWGGGGQGGSALWV